MNTTHYAHLPFRFALGLCAALPLAASALTVNNLSDGSLSGNTLTVTADISGVAANATVELKLVQAEPKDGDPTALMGSATTAATVLCTADGNVSINAHVVLGTKVAFKVVVTEGGDSAESGVKTIGCPDHTKYNWIGPLDGDCLWSNPANWSDGTDNGNRLGYPAYESSFTLHAGFDMVVKVDAPYLDLNMPNDNGCCFGWNGSVATIVGITDNARLVLSGNEQYSSSVTLDHVRVDAPAWTVHAGRYLKMLNGAYLQTKYETNVFGENAYCYVGPGCTIYAGTEWWWNFRLDGKDALIEIENGTIHSRCLRIGSQMKNETPKGVRFLGTTPKMEIDEECIVAENTIPDSPVFEFVIPTSGYAVAPIRKVSSSNNYTFAGHSWTDHSNYVHDAPPILFKVNEYSPFFSGSLTDDILLVDWSYDGNSPAGINTDKTDCGIDYGAFEDPDHNNFYTDSNVDGVAATRVWAHLTGTGEPSSKTLVNSSVSGSASGSTLTVNASLFDYDSGNGSSTATLYVGYTGPAGDPTTNMTAVATTTLANGNDFTMTADVVLGSKTAYAVIVENTQGQWHYTSSTATNIVQVGDPDVEYRWVDNTDGLWSNPANWICSTDDGKNRIGYPSYQNRARWLGNQTAVVHVDGAYTGLADCFWDNAGLNLTLVGDVDGAAVGMSNVRCTGYTDVTFDHVAYSSGSVSAGSGGSLVLTNGATVTSTWEINVNGTDAYMYVGPGCTATVSPNGDWAFRIDGDGARVVIDNGSIIANRVYFGAQRADATPAGIEFRGATPLLSVLKRFRLENAIPGSPVFTFLVPEGGYASAPIQRRGGDYLFLEQKSSETPVCVFQVDRHSPFLNESRTADIPLVEWNSNSGINTAGITLDSSVPGCRLYYTPEEGSTKKALYARLQGHGHTVVLFR